MFVSGLARLSAVAIALLAISGGCAPSADVPAETLAELPLIPPTKTRRDYLRVSSSTQADQQSQIKMAIAELALVDNLQPFADEEPRVGLPPVVQEHGAFNDDDNARLAKPEPENQPARPIVKVDRKPANAARRGDRPQDTIEAVLKKAEPSVVRLDIRTPNGVISGSGVLLDKQGTVVTNTHVLLGAMSGRATFHNKATVAIAGIVGLLDGKDLVLIQLASVPKSAQPIKLATKVNRGERVVTIGTSEGLSFTISEGIVSGLRAGWEIAESLPDSDDFSLDFDSAWVQTTAPMSDGNSGGPLLNMRGEMVGINTFSRIGAQNLNFALSHTHIAALLENRFEEIRPFDIFADPIQIPPDAVRNDAILPVDLDGAVIPILDVPGEEPRLVHKRFRNIKLTNEVSFHEAAVNLSTQELAEMSEIHGIAYCERYPGGSEEWLASWDDGKLHGLARRVTEEGLPLQLMNYEFGKRSGTLRTWSTTGEREYYAEYKNDLLHGFKCLFNDDRPWLIQAYNLGQLDAEFLVSYKTGQPVATEVGNLAAAIKPTAEKAQAAMQAYDKIVAKEDADLRKGFRFWYRDQLDDHRRQVLANIAPERNAIIRQRQNARSTARRTREVETGHALFRHVLGY